MFASVTQIPDRTFNFQQLSMQETNTLLHFLRDVESQLAKPFLPRDDRYVEITFADDYPAFSIFTMQHGTESFYMPRPNPKAKKAPGEVFFTNGGQIIEAGSGTTMTYDCYILGSHRPHLIRYNDTGSTPVIGDRMAPPAGQSYLEKNSNGPFVAVSVPNTVDSWIWVVFNPVFTESTPPPIPPISFLRLGTATLADDLCGEASTTIANARYLDGTSIVGLTAVNNPFNMRGLNGDIILIQQFNLGSGDSWNIYDVKLLTQAQIVGLDYVPADPGTGGSPGDPGYEPPTPCKLQAITRNFAVQYCGDLDGTFDLLTLYEHSIPYSFEVDTETCEVFAKTKKFCMFEETPADGADKTVVTATPVDILLNIHTATACQASQVKPVIAADVQTVYVICTGTPTEEVQIYGVKCSGSYPSC